MNIRHPQRLSATSTALFALGLLASCSDDGDSDQAERIVAKLRKCGLVEQQGKYPAFEDGDSDEARCELECVLGASCADFEKEVCNSDDDTSNAYEQCFQKCSPYKLVECETYDDDGLTKVRACDGYTNCIDESDEANCPDSAFLTCAAEYSDERVPKLAACDGYPDCRDGSDEEGCKDSVDSEDFVCANGERVDGDWACDGEPDCLDESDERDCKLFACKDGSDSVPQEYVCDLETDCDDGSDEDQGCLKIACATDDTNDDGFSAARSPLMSRAKLVAPRQSARRSLWATRKH